MPQTPHLEKHFTAGLEFFDAPGLMQGREVLALGPASWNAWMLGRTDVARKREVRMMTAADGNNPYLVAWSAYFAANLRVFMREYEQAEALAARALELSEKHQFPQIAAYLRCTLGRARAQLGRATEGTGLIRQGIAGLLEVGSPQGISRSTAYLAAAQECEGAIVDALATVEQALQVNPDEVSYRPETFMLRGELRLKQRQTEKAETGFREAIDLARSMEAKAWETRATMSLARLLARHGRSNEAHSMLAAIHGWFTEGFDTADLKDAKALLDELNA
jgi:tetratricopeptide (TPR) repeat protein